MLFTVKKKNNVWLASCGNFCFYIIITHQNKLSNFNFLNKLCEIQLDLSLFIVLVKFKFTLYSSKNPEKVYITVFIMILNITTVG